MSGWGGRWLAILSLIGGLTGAGLLLHDLCIEIKARVAHQRIERAFGRHVADGGAHRPWPWADHYPIGKLEHPELEITRYVLSGATGASLAFSVGHVDGTGRLNGPGNAVLAGHRDTAFRFLKHVRVGDQMRLAASGRTTTYRVRRVEAVHERDVGLLEPGDGATLRLLTCYPFDRWQRGPWRWLVELVPMNAPSTAPPGRRYDRREAREAPLRRSDRERPATLDASPAAGGVQSPFVVLGQPVRQPSRVLT